MKLKMVFSCGICRLVKSLGLANKPMIIGLKANIHEIARTFCTAYPMAKVLYPGKEDFTPRKLSLIHIWNSRAKCRKRRHRSVIPKTCMPP